MKRTNQKVYSTFNVEGPNKVSCRGGHYNLNEDNQVELAVTKLHLLQHFVDLAVERLCNNGELSGMVMDKEITTLSDDLFKKYARFIQAGCDVFEYSEYDEPAVLERFNQRELVNGEMNAGPSESKEGLPVGWWYDFPGFANKTFALGQMVVDMEDSETRFWVYRPGDWQEGGQPIDGLDITKDQLDLLHTKWPELAEELIEVFNFIQKDYEQA